MAQFIISPYKAREIESIVVCDGNSLTEGRTGNTGGQSYPTLLVVYDSLYTITQEGDGGDTTQVMIAEAPTQVDPLYDSDKNNIVVAWEVTNDLKDGGTNQEAYDAMVQYCQERKAVGWSVVLLGTIARGQTGYGGKSIEDYNNDLQAVNAMMEAGYSSYADVYIDLWGDGGFDDYDDTSLYSTDKVHLITAGYQVVAGLVDTAIQQVLYSGEKFNAASFNAASFNID